MSRAMKCQLIPAFLHQTSMALQVNSVPLSETIDPGLPRRATIAARSCATRRPEIECRGIPPKSNRKVKRDCAFALYCERNLVERFFRKIKHFRAIATRYEKDGTKLPGRITSGLRARLA